MDPLLKYHDNSRILRTLVENKTTYNAEYSELNIFETYINAEKINLKFSFPVIASMLSGKKIMHLKDTKPFEFIPGESLIIPSNDDLIIDFPIATKDNPTQCLALGIDPLKIEEITQKFNEHVTIENENNNWTVENNPAHLINNSEINQLIYRLVNTYTKNHKSKDFLLDLMLQELIVRLLQTKARSLILQNSSDLFLDTRIGSTVKYIKQNLTNKDISVEMLAEKACMSVSNFHKKFKNTLGVSPIDYLNSEKIKFSKLLMSENTDLPLSDVAYKTGYNSVSYFIRKFKEHELITPSQYRKLLKAKK